MRKLLAPILVGLLAAIGISGCGPAVPEEELGTLVFEVPKVPGAEEPYELPEIHVQGQPGDAGIDPHPGGETTPLE